MQSNTTLKQPMHEIQLQKEHIPTHYYNILADLPKQLPAPQGNLDLLPKIFPKALLEQEMSTERYIKIPDQVRSVLSKIGRPTALYRAKMLERSLKTPAKIYYKREDMTFSGSHKLNSAISQAYFIAKEGFTHVTTETGAGQWGIALSLAARFFGLKCKIFMVKCSFEQKPYRKYVMKFHGAEVNPSPSDLTEIGKAIQKKDPDCPGSLGIAISEAIEATRDDPHTVYSLGSVLNHVLLHQTVIGQEVKAALDSINVKPDILIGCVGGGSNFAGFCYPFMKNIIDKKSDMQAIAVEPSEVPSMTEGEYRYDYGDDAKLTPKLKMHTLGHTFMPSPIYAGGLRYHGEAPSLSLLKELGYVTAESYDQAACFEAAKRFTETEGIIPAPESSHAIQSVIMHAKKARDTGEEKVIVFNLSGHGLLDLEGYAKVLGF